jgi:5-methylcytosine-specific restriction endonuclease McrA
MHREPCKNRHTKPCAVARRRADTYEHRKWREGVRIRDDYTCQRCWNPGKVVHHIIPFRKSKALFLEDENGITLCNDCHNYVEYEMPKI